MIDDDQLGDETERLAGDREIRRWHVREPLDLPNRLPADEADQSAGEGRMSRNMRGSPTLIEFCESFERCRRRGGAERAIG